MTPAQRKRHLVMWSVVPPLAVLMIVLGWFGRPDSAVQEPFDVPTMRTAPEDGAQP
ncbi:MAG: hypothetical protein ACIAQF_10690 [Phycisphaerales bacterium JB065]